MASWRELALASLAIVVSACAVTAGESLPVNQAENARPSNSGGQVTPDAGGLVTQASIEAAVRADAARVWSRPDPAALQVTTEAVTWADGSLGCPRPGMAYTQALVPGWRLIVRDGGRELVYHASRRGQWVSCAAGRARPPVPGAAIR